MSVVHRSDCPPFELEAKAVRPLVLDLDGSLIKTDMLHEMALAYVKANPLNVFRMAAWLIKGRAHLKQRLAERAPVDVESVPISDRLANFAAVQAARGRPVYIATASNRLVAERMARRFSFVRGVIASDGTTNLKGHEKAKALAERFPGGFDYAGNARSDLPIFQRATEAIVVNPAGGVERAARRSANVTKVFPRWSRLDGLIKALRVHQWAKNLLIFVPIVLSGLITNMTAVAGTVSAFVALCVVASSTYLINDLWDVADDRQHWSKRFRPLANGELPLPWAAVAAPLGIVFGLALGAAVNLAVFECLLLYLVGTLSYSFGLKKVPILDGVILAGLFTLRIGLGVVASGAPPSQWLLVFSMFLFASLSFAKRHTEVTGVLERGGTEIQGRGYRTSDIPILLAAGLSAGMGAVLVMVLYIIDDAFTRSFYGNTVWLWGFPIVIFLFICRIWLVCQRNELSDDPIEFAIKDKVSLGLGAALLVCFAFAWTGFAA